MERCRTKCSTTSDLVTIRSSELRRFFTVLNFCSSLISFIPSHLSIHWFIRGGHLHPIDIQRLDDNHSIVAEGKLGQLLLFSRLCTFDTPVVHLRPHPLGGW